MPQDHITTGSLKKLAHDMIGHQADIQITQTKDGLQITLPTSLIPAPLLNDSRMTLQWTDQIEAIHKALLTKAGLGAWHATMLSQPADGSVCAYQFSSPLTAEEATAKLQTYLKNFDKLSDKELGNLTADAHVQYKGSHNPAIAPTYMPLDSVPPTPMGSKKLSDKALEPWKH